MRIFLAQINCTVGDIAGNTAKIVETIHNARNQGADLLVFPELALTGYPPDDLLLLPHFIEQAENHLQTIITATKNLIVLVGTVRKSDPLTAEKPLYNSAAIIENGQLIGYHDKQLLPTYDVFDERRYFEPGKQTRIWELANRRIGVTICEDLWQHSRLLKDTTYKCDPIKDLLPLKPDLLINLSASPFSTSKATNRHEAVIQAARSLRCPVLLCNQIGGNDSLIFDGRSLVVNAAGAICARGKSFQEDLLNINLDSFSPPLTLQDNPTEDIYNALVLGLRDYFKKLNFTKACLGLSGGIDSAVVACIAAEALGPSNVFAVSMPSRYSSEGSQTDAALLAQNLGIHYQTIPIETVFTNYLELLSPSFQNKPQDITEENLQARIRGMILMALSNKHHWIVLATGNKSELAMGYSTLYGDMCGGLGVISDLTKQQVYALAHWINHNKPTIPTSTLTKPPSAELKPNQKDSDSLPDYQIIDNVLQAYIEEHLPPQQIANKYNYPPQLVQNLISRIHNNEYKRRQSPPGLRISEKAFSIGRRFPIVQKFIL